MKNIINLEIKVQIACSDELAQRLLSDELPQIVVDNLFVDNDRRLLRATVVGDVELCDDTVDISSLSVEEAVLAERTPDPVTKIESDNPDFISLL